MNSMRRTVALILFLCAGFAVAGPVEVEVERFEPKESKVETMLYLKQNRMFFRARLDALREIAKVKEGSDEMDPRHIKLKELGEAIQAAEDSLAVLNRDLRDGAWRESLDGLLTLAGHLDAVHIMLEEQRGRLGVLEEDFTQNHRTSLMVLVSGYPATDTLNALSLVSPFGDTTHVSFSPQDARYLQEGGMARLAYAYVEAADQRWELQLEGPSFQAVRKSDVVVTPPQNRLTFLELNLDSLNREGGALSVTARAWTWEPASGVATR